ncbi:MAG TPA: Crp/Fnr family transcriptional regulator [Pyrinomonadaceae bacterium]|jgi:CRP-like cAMP-binding protein|nr:Crp/Fnr family transcriptional regulator [Pyrinomonadaceae bacterium]
MQHKRACDLALEDRADIIRQLDFGAALSDALLMRLAANSTAIDIRRRRFIYKAGDEANALYSIARGRVKLCRSDEATEREAVIDILPVGSLFGESALYSAAGLRENCAVAYENSRLLRITVGEFKRGMLENRELYDYTFRLIGQRCAQAERRVVDFALDAIPARLEKLLVEYSNRYGVHETGGVLIDIPLPHREIASIVGSTRESVTVRLNALRREGIIDFVNRKILIKRPESLAAA